MSQRPKKTLHNEAVLSDLTGLFLSQKFGLSRLVPTAAFHRNFCFSAHKLHYKRNLTTKRQTFSHYCIFFVKGRKVLQDRLSGWLTSKFYHPFNNIVLFINWMSSQLELRLVISKDILHFPTLILESYCCTHYYYESMFSMSHI
jgi:hypothetical protein